MSEYLSGFIDMATRYECDRGCKTDSCSHTREYERNPQLVKDRYQQVKQGQKEVELLKKEMNSIKDNMARR
jgi:hypothetical protein